MSSILVQDATCSGETCGSRHRHDRQEYSLAEAIGWGEQLRLWIDRRRQRRALGALSERLLRDIDVSPEKAAREAAKGFWQR